MREIGGIDGETGKEGGKCGKVRCEAVQVFIGRSLDANQKLIRFRHGDGLSADPNFHTTLLSAFSHCATHKFKKWFLYPLPNRTR